MNNNLEKIEQIIQKYGEEQKTGFYEASNVIMLCMKQPTANKEIVAKVYMEKYGEDNPMDADGVYKNLYQFRLANSEHRKKDIKVAKEVAKNIYDVILGKSVRKTDYDIKEPAKKIVLLELGLMLKDNIDKKTYDSISRINIHLSMSCYDEIIEFLSTEYTGFDEEFYKNEVVRLQGLLLDTKNNMNENIEKIKLEEQYKLMEMLNSATYGNILNLLSVAKKDMEQAQDIPLHLRTASTLVRRLDDFIIDCGVTPIMPLGQEFEVSAREIHNYIYSGTPFQSHSDVKKVFVTSSGFEICKRNIIISNPEIQEA